MKKILLPALILITSLSFSACGNAEKKNTEVTNDSTTATATTPAGSVEPSTEGNYQVSFLDEKGNSVDLKSLKGKVVFINFWATWCPPCIEELPSINNLRKGYKDNDNIVFLMVDVDSEIEQSTAFMKENSYDLPVFIPNSEIPSEFLAGAIPTTVVLDKRGNIAERVEGGQDYDTQAIKDHLNELIQAK